MLNCIVYITGAVAGITTIIVAERGITASTCAVAGGIICSGIVVASMSCTVHTTGAAVGSILGPAVVGGFIENPYAAVDGIGQAGAARRRCIGRTTADVVGTIPTTAAVGRSGYTRRASDVVVGIRSSTTEDVYGRHIGRIIDAEVIGSHGLAGVDGTTTSPCAAEAGIITTGAGSGHTMLPILDVVDGPTTIIVAAMSVGVRVLDAVAIGTIATRYVDAVGITTRDAGRDHSTVLTIVDAVGSITTTAAGAGTIVSLCAVAVGTITLAAAKLNSIDHTIADEVGIMLTIVAAIGTIASPCAAVAGITTHAVGKRSCIDLITAAAVGFITITVAAGGIIASPCVGEDGTGSAAAGRANCIARTIAAESGSTTTIGDAGGIIENLCAAAVGIG